MELKHFIASSADFHPSPQHGPPLTIYFSLSLSNPGNKHKIAEYDLSWPCFLPPHLIFTGSFHSPSSCFSMASARMTRLFTYVPLRCCVFSLNSDFCLSQWAESSTMSHAFPAPLVSLGLLPNAGFHFHRSSVSIPPASPFNVRFRFVLLPNTPVFTEIPCVHESHKQKKYTYSNANTTINNNDCRTTE